MKSESEKEPATRYIIAFFFVMLLSLNMCYGSVISGEGYTSGVNEGYYTHYSFINYCPLCGAHESLDIGVKRYDELTCVVCDADYSFSGKDKTYKPRAWLITYVPEEVVVPVEQPDPKQEFLTKWANYQGIIVI